MALRECPNCKKNVSDSVNICIHCGYDFNAVEQEKSNPEQQASQIKFSSLSLEEQLKYEHEFYDNQDGFKKTKLINILSSSIDKISYICCAPFIIILLMIMLIYLAKKLAWIASELYINKDLLIAAAIIAIVLLVTGIICAIVGAILKKISDRDLIKYNDAFIDWLRDTKQIYF